MCRLYGRTLLSGLAEFAFRRGVRVLPERVCSWGFGACSPVVIDFGRLRLNRWWWHNLHATYAIVYRLHYGEWPLYHQWRKGRR